MGNRNASSMWKMTAKVIGAFVPPSLPMDFRWTLQHWVEAVCSPHSHRTGLSETDSVETDTKQLSLNKCFNYENSLFYGVFPGTKEKAVSYISSPGYVRIICTEEQLRLIFAGLRAADQPSPCTALLSALCKIARSHTLTAERANEACSQFASFKATYVSKK